MQKIIFLCGESGSGKTHLQNNLIRLDPEKFTRIISTTSRTPREGEEDGIAYHFVSRHDFEDMIYKEELLQHVNWGTNYYGTQIKEYGQKQNIGLFVCTMEGVNDTINALTELDFEFEYEMIFFLTTNQKLQEHGVPLDRLGRGNIRKDFLDGYIKNEFDLPITILQDHNINDDLALTLYRSINSEIPMP